MKQKSIFVVFDCDAGKIYARSVTISEAAQEYYSQSEIVKIIGGGNSVIAFPSDQYNGPIHENISFDIRVMGDYVATMITKEETNND